MMITDLNVAQVIGLLTLQGTEELTRLEGIASRLHSTIVISLTHFLFE